MAVRMLVVRLLLLLFLSVAVVSALYFDVQKYGAKGDGATDDTKAFQNAWAAACSSAGAAIVVVPAGKRFLLKPCTFSGPCQSNVQFKVQGTLVASSNRADFGDINHWLLFTGINNLNVAGGGTVDGNGAVWWQKSCKRDNSQPCKNAPTAMKFSSCGNLTVSNLTVRNSQQIHVSFEDCTTVTAAKLVVSAPADSPNTDGIHVTRSSAVVITGCTIGTGDDCVSIVSGSKNVKVRGMSCGPGHGISIGSLGAMNTEAEVSDVHVDTATLTSTQNGARIKTWQGGRGFAKNIFFSNLKMQNVQNPIIIDQNYCDSSKPCSDQASAVQVSNVVFKNVTGTSASKYAIDLDCSTAAPCRGIVLQNIELKNVDGSTAQSSCKNVKLKELSSVSPAPQCH